MRERPLIFDSEHLSLRGDRNHIIVEFKGEPALIDPIGKISHPAVNWLTKVAPEMEHRIIRISAFAVIKGRGIKMRTVSPHGDMQVNLMWHEEQMPFGGAQL